MRILKIKATNRIIEAQSHATEGTLLSNALSRGFDASEVEESLVTNEQYNTLIDAQNEADKTYSDKRKESYPPATDYLDGVVKGDQAQIDKYIADCLAVKQRFPK